MRDVFITGTDTDIGKTFVTCILLEKLSARGQQAIGMKPVASGADLTNQGLRNADALALRARSHPKLSYETINPCVYREPASPHIAATETDEPLNLQRIGNAYQHCTSAAEIVLVEGVGGWRVPLSDNLQTVDLVRYLSLPVVLVCGMRLGCISHTLLSVETILTDRVELLGWIANEVDPSYRYGAQTISTLSAAVPAPLLGIVPWHPNEDADIISRDLDAGVQRLWPLDGEN